MPRSNQRNLAWPFQRQTVHGLNGPFPEKGVEREHGWPHACPQLRRDPEGRIQVPRVGFRGISLPLLKTTSFQHTSYDSLHINIHPHVWLHPSASAQMHPLIIHPIHSNTSTSPVIPNKHTTCLLICFHSLNIT